MKEQVKFFSEKYEDYCEYDTVTCECGHRILYKIGSCHGCGSITILCPKCKKRALSMLVTDDGNKLETYK
jgi:DNA-directed RNA polymerase subunit RPC12/RpoP